ncbi:MAG: DUF4325 domain-containing protein [Puia sp.]|nr:DUF4325 domain-containing protein [Puia sp.]
METVKLVDIIGSASAVSPRTGMIAYDFVTSRISSGTPVRVSFAGIEDLTSAFCNSFIGKLYMNFDPSVLKSLFQIEGIPEGHIWQKKIQSAILLGTNENARNLHKDNLAEVILS